MKTIAVLTGGGDVPGLNVAIRALVLRAAAQGIRVLGIRRGWAGLVELEREPEADNSRSVVELTPDTVRTVARTGGTFLHTSRTRPSHTPPDRVPGHVRRGRVGGVYDRGSRESGAGEPEIEDLTPEVLANLEYLEVDTLIPIGGDDTLSYAHRLHGEGVGVVALPKTMDNDVPGTDYCIGFSTCVTRTLELAHGLRTAAGSHERIMVIEVFGRYAGFTALVPTLAGAADRCVIPEHPFDPRRLVELLVADRAANPSRYAVVLVSEGATFAGQDEMSVTDHETDAYGHKKLGGVGDRVAGAIKALSPEFNQGQRVNTMSQRLAYLVRSGAPDTIDSLVPQAFAHLAMDLVAERKSGVLVALTEGRYRPVSLEVLAEGARSVDVGSWYDPEELRPNDRELGRASIFGGGAGSPG